MNMSFNFVIEVEANIYKSISVVQLKVLPAVSYEVRIISRNVSEFSECLECEVNTIQHVCNLNFEHSAIRQNDAIWNVRFV